MENQKKKPQEHVHPDFFIKNRAGIHSPRKSFKILFKQFTVMAVKPLYVWLCRIHYILRYASHPRTCACAFPYPFCFPFISKSSARQREEREELNRNLIGCHKGINLLVSSTVSSCLHGVRTHQTLLYAFALPEVTLTPGPNLACANFRNYPTIVRCPARIRGCEGCEDADL